MKLSARHRNIITRRESLVARNDAYRSQIKRDFNQLRHRFDYAANMVGLVNSLRSKIGIISGIVALLTVRRSGAMISLLRRGWIVWQLIRRFRRV